jgi:hypothetical protein
MSSTDTPPQKETHPNITVWSEPRDVSRRMEVRAVRQKTYPMGDDGTIPFLPDQESEDRKTQLYENKMVFSVPEFGVLRRNERLYGGLDHDWDSDCMTMMHDDASETEGSEEGEEGDDCEVKY